MEPDNYPAEETSAFAARRNKQLAALDPAAARAAANQAYGRSIRSGQALSLPQPQNVLAYGARLSAPAALAPSPTQSSAAAPSSIGAKAWDAVLEANAAARAASNAITFGGADRLAAAGDALFQPGGLSNWGQRYNANLQQEFAQDRYDMTHRPVAQAIGNVGGGALGLLAFGPEEAAAAAAPRLAGAMRLTAKEAAGIAGAGGLAGLGSQGVSDIVTGHRSTPQDKVGSIAGGMAGAAALPFLGPSRAGAVDGAVTSATQDLLNGRSISIPQTVQSALTGGLLAGATGSVGRNWSNGLSRTEKGQLGEAMGATRSALGGEPRWQGPKVRAPLDPEQTTPLKGKGTYVVPDGLGGPPPADPGEPWPDLFEDKFGYQADTSANQKIAQTNFGTRFRLNHFTPSDVGMMTAFPFLTSAPQFVRQNPGR
jgi:hypothetical protein